MGAVKLVKSIYTGSDVTSLGEVAAADTPTLPGPLTVTTILSSASYVGSAPTELTIASGEITVTQTLHFVDTESDAASDTLVTINGGSAGMLLAFRAAHTDRTVIISETGNIYAGGSDITLDSTSKYVLFVYDNTLTKWVVVGGTGGGSGTGNSLTKSIHQVSHGFSAKDVVYLAGASTYSKAKADTVETAEAVGIVSVTAGADDFTLATSGWIENLSGLTAGTVYFVSDATSGLLTAAEPTTEGHVSKPMFIADTTTSGYVVNMRGSVIGPGSTCLITTFTNADLTAGVLTVTHSFGHQYTSMPTIIDNNGKTVIPDDVDFISTTQLTVDLSSQGTISGTWRVVVQDTGASTAADAVSDTAYDATSWSGITTVAPSKNAVRDKIESMNTVPVGTVLTRPVSTVPTGYLECDGSAISKTTYAALYAVLKDGGAAGIYGESTTFNLPDYRGRFLRGWAHGQTTDPDKATRTDRGDGTGGDVVGSKQADEFKSHYHSIFSYTNSAPAGTGAYGAGGSQNTGAAGGNETRPINVNVMYVIKY